LADKLIRDELLRSDRYVRLSNDTVKLLFMHLMLSSDALSNAEATPTAIGLAMGRPFDEAAIATMLAELQDRDLVRLYEDQGKRYVHIPRSRQRIRYLSGKHPRPPANVEDIEISALVAKVGLKSDLRQAQVGPFAPEEKRSVVDEKRGSTAPAPNGASVDNSGKWWATIDTMIAFGKSIGVTARRGETRDDLYRQIRKALRERAEALNHKP
jgi:hypothetical protein